MTHYATIKKEPHKSLKKLTKTIITFYFAVYEQFYLGFEQVFSKIDM